MSPSPTRMLPSPAGTCRLLAASLLGLAVACGPPTPPRDRNLLLVTFDTLRADRLGAYGNDEWGGSPSPNIDALARRGVLFETSYVARGQTHPSIATLLTGRYPITHGLRENGYPLPQDETTLFEHLRAAGYQTGVFAANLEVDVEEWAYRGADVRGDGYAGRMREEARQESRFQRIWDDRVEEAARAFLGAVDTSRPFALWVHFYDVHKPYNPPGDHVQRFGLGEGVPDALRRPGPDSGPVLFQYLAGITLSERPVADEELRRVRGLYDGGISATDERLGRLLKQLQDLGEDASTYVVFTSDHGEELYDHNRYFFHGASIHDGTVRVPLVVAGPDLPAGRRTDALVQNVDVAPTVLELLGLAADPRCEGRSLVPLLTGATEEAPAPFAFVEWQDLVYAVSDGRHKLIWNPQHVWTRKEPYQFGGPGAGYRIDCLEGYDLGADPLEQENLLAGVDLGDFRGGQELPPEFRRLYQALLDWQADPQHQRTMEERVLDDDQVQRLADLGYVATTGSMSEGRGDSVRKEPCRQR